MVCFLLEKPELSCNPKRNIRNISNLGGHIKQLKKLAKIDTKLFFSSPVLLDFCRLFCPRLWPPSTLDLTPEIHKPQDSVKKKKQFLIDRSHLLTLKKNFRKYIFTLR